MTTNEAREKLDLEPKEDLEDEYGKPESSEPEGGGGGLFSDSAELQDIEDIDTTPPEGVQEQAEMAQRWKDETGNPNDCGTQTGWTRASQLSSGESLSEDTINRMVSFFARHESTQEPDEAKEDCSRMMWKAWGGDAGRTWAESKQEEFETARENSKALNSVDLSNTPAWDQHFVEMHERVFEAEPDTNLLSFSGTATPDFVKERLREAILSDTVFSAIAGLGSQDLRNLKEQLREAVSQADQWTIDGVAEQLQNVDGIDDIEKARTVARTEVAATVNSAREEGYEEMGQGDSLFYWSGALDNRTTDACEWLINKTNPFEDGDPVPMDELKELIDEAPTHDDDMQDDLARPDVFVVHPQERKQFIRAPESGIE
jgi:hypothetical protein